MKVVAGIPAWITHALPVAFRHGPIIIEEATPPITPASSPLLSNIMVLVVAAGPLTMNTLVLAVEGLDMDLFIMLGKGAGMPNGGVLHTSAGAMELPETALLAMHMLFSYPK